MTTAVKPRKPTNASQAAGRRVAGAGAATAATVRSRAEPATPEAGKPGKVKRAAPAASGRTGARAAAAPVGKPGKPPAAAPAEKVKKPSPVRTGAVPAKLNKRSGDTISKILAATEEIILQSGAERISILDVCEESGISRGTFYRYFSSQDDLLDAFSRHKRDQFHSRLTEAVMVYEDPDERFQAMLNYLDDYLENSRARRLLLVAPEYATRWFQRIFHDSVLRFQSVLSVVFDAWEERRGIVLDRELICELIVRFIMSDVLVPSGPDRRNLMRRVERFIVMLLSGRVARR